MASTKILHEFREFAVKGNVVDLAVGVIIGAAFGAVVKSLVDDLVMPLVGLLTGGIDFSNRYVALRGNVPGNATLAQARATPGASVFAYGAFVNNVLTFLIVAWAVFLMVKGMNRIRRRTETKPAAPTERACPECLSAIPKAAKRCKACGVAVTPEPAAPAPAT